MPARGGWLLRAAAMTPGLYLVGICQSPLDGLAPDLHGIRQAIAVGRVILAGNQWCEIAPAGGRDPEAVRSDEIARHFLFDIGHIRQLHRLDLPAIGLRGLADDG